MKACSLDKSTARPTTSKLFSISIISPRRPQGSWCFLLPSQSRRPISGPAHIGSYLTSFCPEPLQRDNPKPKTRLSVSPSPRNHSLSHLFSATKAQHAYLLPQTPPQLHLMSIERRFTSAHDSDSTTYRQSAEHPANSVLIALRFFIDVHPLRPVPTSYHATCALQPKPNDGSWSSSVRPSATKRRLSYFMQTDDDDDHYHRLSSSHLMTTPMRKMLLQTSNCTL